MLCTVTFYAIFQERDKGASCREKPLHCTLDSGGALKLKDGKPRLCIIAEAWPCPASLR